jgi:GT2 family glycosyltransferase
MQRKIVSINKSEKPVQAFRQNIDSTNLLSYKNTGNYQFKEFPLPKIKKADISVIVYLNGDFSWIPNDKIELILIQDGGVLKTQFPYPCRLLFSQDTFGCAPAYNQAAKIASGKSLFFINSNTQINNLNSLVNLLEDKTIGLVSPISLQDGGLWNNSVENIGFEWDWESLSFLKSGKDIWHNKKLSKPLQEFQKTNYYVEAVENFGIRRELFDEIGGFHPHYGIGQWHNYEMSLSLREKRYKHIVCSDSIAKVKPQQITKDNNRDIFINKWVYSHRIDQLVKNQRKEKPSIRNILLECNGSSEEVIAAGKLCIGLKKRYFNVKIIMVTNKSELLVQYPIDKFIEPGSFSERNFQLYWNLNLLSKDKDPLTVFAQETGIDAFECK